jgi:hypothetical protein
MRSRLIDAGPRVEPMGLIEESDRVTGRPDDQAGVVDGRHFTDWVEDVRGLHPRGDDDAALALLYRLMDAVEREVACNRWPAPTWYFEQAAIIHRKRKDSAAELEPAADDTSSASPTLKGRARASSAPATPRTRPVTIER